MKNMNKIMMILVAILAITTTGWSQTTVANEFKYCYDCQRSPAYPTTSDNCELWSFKKPYVGNGSVGNQATSNDGPWKIVYLGEWSATNTFGVSSVSFASSSNTYNYTGSVPIFKLCKKNGSNYDSVAVGVVCAYANTSNTIDHAILFVAAKTTGDLHYGCFLTDKVHSSDVYITFDEDLSSGLPNFKQEASPQVVNYTLTLSSNNTQYGTVSAEGTGVVPNNNGTYTVPAGTQVTVTATPSPGSHFVNWNGNQNLTNPSHQITVNSDQTFTANFDYKIYNMPSQWTVKANNESVNVTNGTTDGIQDGKTVKITPAPGQKILTVKMKKKTN